MAHTVGSGLTDRGKQRARHHAVVELFLICLNQMEMWLSTQVRKAIRRGSFTSVEALTRKVLSFIDCFGLITARPFRCTCTGKALAI